jgi:dihydrodipicolinate synthase/N-acetylneuraminate lyase
VRLKGAIAAAITPLSDGGRKLDESSFSPFVNFLAGAGLDGSLACGTTGESLLLSIEERRRAAELFVEARPEGFLVAVHAGAQTTEQTVALAGHAKLIDADAVAVIAPPFFLLDEEELLHHFEAAAAACDPVPFYVYEFAARSGYAVPTKVIGALRDRAPNLAGLKVSDTPASALEPYLQLEGLDVFIGYEPLVLGASYRGAVGAVSGLASAWPEPVVSLVRDRDEQANAKVTFLRDSLAGKPFHSSVKNVLAAKGVIADPSVRLPLRSCTAAERETALAL